MSPPVLTSKLLDVAGVRHAFFTRRGGVSEGIYASLNVGLGSRDDPAAVIENRPAAAPPTSAPRSIVTAYQVHSALALGDRRALVADSPPQADGVVSATAGGVVCGALAADCAPVLLADPDGRVVAACHAGWKGALGGVVEATDRADGDPGSPARSPARRRRALHRPGSPTRWAWNSSTGSLHEDGAYGSDSSRPASSQDKRMFDLPAFVLGRLQRGRRRGPCEWVGHDTCAEEADFFSNRRAFKRGEADYGRLLSAIALHP